MSATLYDRVKALEAVTERPKCHSRVREETKDREVFSSLPITRAQVTFQTLPADRRPCPHVTDPELAAWYAEHPKVVCARCWLERGR
jgi:hypothetical protein